MISVRRVLGHGDEMLRVGTCPWPGLGALRATEQGGPGPRRRLGTAVPSAAFLCFPGTSFSPESFFALSAVLSWSLITSAHRN